ncbi:hypothetical protein CCACVL1_23223 [Corchorus capsularis]|uniref:Uncharacterized protein n=1 Tax=Corchorus capsularis TaxID=210143 RepID=A0A1R3GUU9_COCAP|nr:hypothetical protein CCACVL1_23223 [Corchorus capsularis]
MKAFDKIDYLEFYSKTVVKVKQQIKKLNQKVSVTEA